MTSPSARRYRTIVADPPWPLNWQSGPRPSGAKAWSPTLTKKPMPYETMTVGDIAALPVEAMAEDDAHLFLWTFDRHVLSGAATLVARAWGFEPTGHMIIWDKGHYGLGRFPRPQHEIVVLARRGKLPFQVADVASVQRWKAVSTRGRAAGRSHSAKPDGSIDMIERASPGPYVELFARRARFGWDYWGDESLSTAEMPAGLGRRAVEKHGDALGRLADA